MYLYKEKDALSLKVGQEWSSQLQFGLSQACRHNLRPTPFCWYIRHSTIKVQYMNIDLASCNHCMFAILRYVGVELSDDIHDGWTTIGLGSTSICHIWTDSTYNPELWQKAGGVL